MQTKVDYTDQCPQINHLNRTLSECELLPLQEQIKKAAPLRGQPYVGVNGRRLSGRVQKDKSGTNIAPLFNIPQYFYDYFFITSAIFLPISAGLCTTWIPHSAMIFIFASAVSSAPPIIAPAWPIRRPGGAV